MLGRLWRRRSAANSRPVPGCFYTPLRKVIPSFPLRDPASGRCDMADCRESAVRLYTRTRPFASISNEVRRG